MNKKKSFLLLITGILFLLTCLSYLFDLSAGTGPWLIGFFISLSLALNASPKYKGFSFTVLIFAAVSIAMYYPQYLVELNGFEFKKLIVPLLQIIMFGMGTAMSFKDFYGVIKMPKGVFIGLTCQFTIMPLLGFSLASLFNFPRNRRRDHSNRVFPQWTCIQCDGLLSARQCRSIGNLNGVCHLASASNDPVFDEVFGRLFRSN